MAKQKTTSTIWAYPRSGAIAGAVSAFAFAIIHQLFISDIWFSLIIMNDGGRGHSADLYRAGLFFLA